MNCKNEHLRKQHQDYQPVPDTSKVNFIFCWTSSFHFFWYTAGPCPNGWVFSVRRILVFTVLSKWPRVIDCSDRKRQDTYFLCDLCFTCRCSKSFLSLFFRSTMIIHGLVYIQRSLHELLTILEQIWVSFLKADPQHSSTPSRRESKLGNESSAHLNWHGSAAINASRTINQMFSIHFSLRGGIRFFICCITAICFPSTVNSGNEHKQEKRSSSSDAYVSTHCNHCRISCCRSSRCCHS